MDENQVKTVRDNAIQDKDKHKHRVRGYCAKIMQNKRRKVSTIQDKIRKDKTRESQDKRITIQYQNRQDKTRKTTKQERRQNKRKKDKPRRYKT